MRFEGEIFCPKVVRTLSEECRSALYSCAVSGIFDFVRSFVRKADVLGFLM